MRIGWNPYMIAMCARTVGHHSPARSTQVPKEAPFCSAAGNCGNTVSGVQVPSTKC